MKGKLIVVEGLDGSGKATQSALIFDMLKAEGRDVRKVSFPNYSSDASAPLRMYLAG
jgi:dTMP kinase